MQTKYKPQNIGYKHLVKHSSIILTVFIFVIFSSCIISKKSTDNSVTKYVTKNSSMVKEAAEFAVSVTYDHSKKEFWVKDVEDKSMRSKIASLGNHVSVTYANSSYYEIPDSNVTFMSMTLFGVTEIIYDFASTPREFVNKTENRKQYYFVKLTDRIYYRRRQIPMM
jgi:uncharacterized protein YktB (UPF0637 family)